MNQSEKSKAPRRFEKQWSLRTKMNGGRRRLGLTKTHIAGWKSRAKLIASRVERTTKAADRMDEDRVLPIALQLLTQAHHVHVHSPIRKRVILAPHGIQQLFAAENDTLLSHQELQQPELSARKRKRNPFEAQLASYAIQFDVT